MKNESKELPPISIYIASCNSARNLPRAIESVLANNYPADKTQLIVVDDGSTDETTHVIQSYLPHLHFEQQPHSGKAAAVSRGLLLSKGKFFFYLDADDWFLPNKIKKVIETFQSDQDLVHIGHACVEITENASTGEGEIIPKHLCNRPISGHRLLSYYYQTNRFFGLGSAFCARMDFLKTLQLMPKVDLCAEEGLLLFLLVQGKSMILPEVLAAKRSPVVALSGKERNRRLERLVNSKLALEKQVIGSEVPKEVQHLYVLSRHVAELSAKEQVQAKTMSDIVDFARFLWQHRDDFGPQPFGTLKKYAALEKLLPSLFLRFSKSRVSQ